MVRAVDGVLVYVRHPDHKIVPVDILAPDPAQVDDQARVRMHEHALVCIRSREQLVARARAHLPVHVPDSLQSARSALGSSRRFIVAGNIP